MEQANEAYGIPPAILREYERLAACKAQRRGMAAQEYDERDLERMSLMMTLHDIGFTAGQVETYMRLLLQGDDTAHERLRMLNDRRRCTLEEIHLRERQMDRLDYLRHEMRKTENKHRQE
ncbi:MerR family transcriptional regulator [Feifania hominis]